MDIKGNITTEGLKSYRRADRTEGERAPSSSTMQVTTTCKSVEGRDCMCYKRGDKYNIN